MNRFRNLLAIFAFSLLILGLPSFVSAQRRNQDDDYYGRNNRNDDYNRGNRRNNGYYNNGNLQSAIKRLKNNSREFERRIDRELDNSRWNGGNREDYVNQLANDFKNAASRLDNSFGNGRNGDMDRSYDEAQQVLNIGSQLDREISRMRGNYNISNDWNSIRQDLRTVADAYGYNYNNRNYPNNNRNYPNNYPNSNRNGSWRDRIPFPLPF